MCTISKPPTCGKAFVRCSCTIAHKQDRRSVRSDVQKLNILAICRIGCKGFGFISISNSSPSINKRTLQPGSAHFTLFFSKL